MNIAIYLLLKMTLISFFCWRLFWDQDESTAIIKIKTGSLDELLRENYKDGFTTKNERDLTFYTDQMLCLQKFSIFESEGKSVISLI